MALPFLVPALIEKLVEVGLITSVGGVLYSMLTGNPVTEDELYQMGLSFKQFMFGRKPEIRNVVDYNPKSAYQFATTLRSENPKQFLALLDDPILFMRGNADEQIAYVANKILQNSNILKISEDELFDPRRGLELPAPVTPPWALPVSPETGAVATPNAAGAVDTPDTDVVKRDTVYLDNPDQTKSIEDLTRRLGEEQARAEENERRAKELAELLARREAELQGKPDENSNSNEESNNPESDNQNKQPWWKKFVRKKQSKSQQNLSDNAPQDKGSKAKQIVKKIGIGLGTVAGADILANIEESIDSPSTHLIGHALRLPGKIALTVRNSLNGFVNSPNTKSEASPTESDVKADTLTLPETPYVPTNEDVTLYQNTLQLFNAANTKVDAYQGK